MTSTGNRSSAATPAAYGVATWSTAAWRGAAVAWVDERLAAAGMRRAGPVEQPRVRPWATVLRIPTTAGRAWFKAAAPATAFEVRLYDVLARTVPDRVLTPIAGDADRGWLLLPDGGPALGARTDGEELIAALQAALVQYAALQRALEPYVGELLAAGVGDMRPAAMPARFEEALAASGAERTDAALHARLVALRPAVRAWCERLAALPLPASLDHNDLHPWNILGDPVAGGARYYDWGDSVVAHPFAAMLVPFALVRRLAGDARLARVRDAYVDVFADRAPRAELAEALAVAGHVATIARALTWERAVRSAREQGERLDPEWEAAPLRTLAGLLDARSGR